MMVAYKPWFLRNPNDACRALEQGEHAVRAQGFLDKAFDVVIVAGLSLIGLKLLAFLGAEALPHVFNW